MLKWTSKLVGCLAAAAMALAGGGALAQSDYPTRPITFVVPYAAGGATDVAVRVIAEAMAKDVGQNIVVVNKAGGGATIAAKSVAEAAPDGYTVLVAVAANLITNPIILDNVGYDPIADFEPVSLLSANPVILVSSKESGFTTLGEVIEAAKADPGVIPVASYGIGTPSHLAIELLEAQAGIDLIHIPFNGGAPAQTALMGGHVPLMMNILPSEVEPLKAGEVVGLAIGQMKESAFAPGVPTFSEAGVKDFEALTFFGLVVPAGTPGEIVERLNAAAQTALTDENVVATLTRQGMAIWPTTAEGFGEMIATETTKWAPIIKAAGLK